MCEDAYQENDDLTSITLQNIIIQNNTIYYLYYHHYYGCHEFIPVFKIGLSPKIIAKRSSDLLSIYINDVHYIL